MVHDFSIKYSGKEHALNLKTALKKIQDNHRLGRDIVNWDSTKVGLRKIIVQLSMPGYIRAALHDLQHKKPKQPQESPYPWTQPVYGKENQTLSEKAPAEQ